jgi:2-keto-3-deoxy-galactonokinase
MGSLYLALPRASNIPIVVATTTAVKTVLQVATPSTTDIRVFAWGVSFDGVTANADPGICTLMDTDVAASVTTVTAIEWESDDQVASLCVGGASATGYNASAEGSIGATTRDLDPQLVHPQTGYSIWFLPGRHSRVKASRFLRIRTTFAVSINCLPWIIWEEPA